MNITYTINHIFIPGYSNNHKAKALHSSSLILLAGLLVVVYNLLRILSSPQVAILGYASNIPPQAVIELTNQKRAEAGVGQVSLDESLSEAARLKAQDMLKQDYWAHVAPDGTEPWDFFRSVGYVYRYAGENLARDFTNPADTVEAWLASPSHRENMLSGKYTEIGVAVVEGDLNGKDTTLIVQFFGTPSSARSSIPVAAAQVAGEPRAKEVSPAGPIPSLAVGGSAEPVVKASSFDVMRAFTIGLVSVLLAVLAVDVVAISRRGVTRVGGRAFAHLSFMAMVLIILLLARAGEIL